MFDLMHRDPSGRIDHIFYGVSEWGLTPRWREVVEGLRPPVFFKSRPSFERALRLWRPEALAAAWPFRSQTDPAAHPPAGLAGGAPVRGRGRGAWAPAGRGRPVTFYLDDVRFE